MFKFISILVASGCIFAGTANAAVNLPLHEGGDLSVYEEEAKRALEMSQAPAGGSDLPRLVNDRQKAATAERNRLAKEMGVDVDALAPHIQANQAREEYDGKHILVFISSSLPQATISNLYKQIGDRDDVVFLLRGVIGDPGKIKPTQEWVKAILCPSADGEEPDSCYKAPIDINPVFFDRMDITEVPAIAYVPEPSALLTTCSEGTGAFYTFFGDFAPSYALERIASAIPEDDQLKAILTSMRKPFHEGAGK